MSFYVTNLSWITEMDSTLAVMITGIVGIFTLWFIIESANEQTENNEQDDSECNELESKDDLECNELEFKDKSESKDEFENTIIDKITEAIEESENEITDHISKINDRLEELEKFLKYYKIEEIRKIMNNLNQIYKDDDTNKLLSPITNKE